MKRKNLTVLLAGIMVLSTLATGCGSKPAPKDEKAKVDLSSQLTEITKASDPSKTPSIAKSRKDTIVIGLDAPEGVFNPLYTDSMSDFYIYETMFNYLCDVDDKGNPVEGLAKTWDISADGLKYTFHLNKDIKFSDGTPLTAEDVLFTYSVACDPTYTGPQDTASWNLKGYKEFNAGDAANLEGIKKLDDQTIEFNLTQPNSCTMYSLAQVGILSKNYYGKDYKKGNLKGVEALHRKPMGSGQYKMANYKEGQELDLVANDNYFKGKPKIEKLIFKVTSEDTRIQMLTTGEIDTDMVTIKPEAVAQLKAAGFLNLQIFPTNGYGYIAMNHKNPMFTDPKVRQALTYGLNRKQIVASIFKDYANVQNEPTSKVSWTYTDDVNKYDFDADKANKLLDEAGWKKGTDGIRAKDGKKFEIHFSASTPSDVNNALIPIAKDNYEKLGIKFIPESLEFNAVRKKEKSGDFEMYFIASALTSNPDGTSSFGTKGAQNYAKYSNTKVDDLYAKALLENDLAKRKAIYGEVYKELNADVAQIFIYQRRDLWPVSSRIEGITITPYRDFTYDLWKATIK